MPSMKDKSQPISDFFRHFGKFFKKMRETQQPIVFRQHGRAIAVLVDADYFQDLAYEKHLRDAYMRGLKDIEEGRVISHEEVMKMIHQKIKNLKRT